MSFCKIKHTPFIQISFTPTEAEKLRALMQNISPNYHENEELMAFSEKLFEDLTETLSELP